MRIYLAGVTNKYGKGAVLEEKRIKAMGSRRLFSYHHIATTKDVQPDIVKVWFSKRIKKQN